MILVLNTEFTLRLYQIDLPPKPIINKHFGSWFQIFIYLVEGFTIGLSDANGRQADVFQSIENVQTQVPRPVLPLLSEDGGI